MIDPGLVAVARQIVESLPFNRLLGLRVADFEVGLVKIDFDMRPELIGNTARGVLHGGVISSALDLVGGATALSRILADRAVSSPDDVGRVFSKFGTIDLRVDYLRPGAGSEFVASGTVLRAGRRVAVTRMELHNDSGDLIALGTGTYSV
jgi:uncharacterized protein (TIGR00369 family)